MQNNPNQGGYPTDGAQQPFYSGQPTGGYASMQPQQAQNPGQMPYHGQHTGGYAAMQPQSAPNPGQMPYNGQPTGGYAGMQSQPVPNVGQAPYNGQPTGGYAGMQPVQDGNQGRYGAMQEYADARAARARSRMPLWQVLLILVCVLATGWYVYNTFFATENATYAYIEAGTLGAHYTGDALIVRSETPYDAEGVTSIEYLAEEGKSILRNMPICNVFSSGFSTREMTTLQDYRDQIRDYQISLLSSETTTDAQMARVESDVLARSREVRELISGARGNLANQEKLLNAAITARQQYIKKKYSSDQRLSRLLDDEQAQLQRIDSWTKQYVAARESIISFYSDGYEYGLTTDNYDTFTPQQVRAMVGGALPEAASVAKGKTTVYRTVNDNTWNVLMLVEDQSWNPVEGQTYELQLERFENTQVSATVSSFTRSGGELLVRLTVHAPVTPVLYMRTCRAELGDYVTTLKVPARAIYHYNDMDGVVLVDGQNQSFIPVSIVTRDGNDVYITAVYQGLLYEGLRVRLF